MNGTVNKVVLIGRIGDDIKLTYFDKGRCVGQFRLATNEEYTSRTTGEKVVNTEWQNIVVHNKLAEVIEKYTLKGDLIYLEGRLKTRQWQGDDGITRYMTEVHVSDINLLPNKREGQPTTTPPTEEVPKVDDGLPF